jgi:hypothetical protein
MPKNAENAGKWRKMPTNAEKCRKMLNNVGFSDTIFRCPSRVLGDSLG